MKNKKLISKKIRKTHLNSSKNEVNDLVKESKVMVAVGSSIDSSIEDKALSRLIKNLLNVNQKVENDEPNLEKSSKQGISEQKYLLKIAPYSQDNSMKGVLLKFENITQIPNEQEPSVLKENIYRSALDMIPVAAFLINESGNVIFINQRAEQIIYASKNQIYGQPFKTLFLDSSDSSADFNNAVDRKFEYFIKRKEKIPLSVQIEFRTFYSYTEKITLALVTDFSENKKNEDELKFLHNKLERISKSMSEGMWEFDLNSKVITLSQRFKELLGYKGVDLDVRLDNWGDLVHPDDRTLFLSVLDPLKILKDSFYIESRMKNSNGDYRYFRVKAYVSKDENEIATSISGSISDIHSQKIDEAKLRRSNVALEEFAYVTSHDLKAPLRHLQAYVDILRKDLSQNALHEAQKAMDIIDMSAKKMADMVGGLLSVSQIRKSGFTPVITDLNGLVHSTIDLLSQEVKDSGATIQIGILPSLVLDPRLVKQVFQNLILNAIKFRKPGVPPKISIDAFERVDSWEFAITDNGIGIDLKYSDRVFQIFQRLNDEKIYPGTGIGLSIAKKIVELHFGKIWFEPAPNGNQGTTFRFTIFKKVDLGLRAHTLGGVNENY